MKNYRMLRYDYLAADLAGVKGHAQRNMEKLGIQCLEAVPQSMGDCWHFWGCSNAPDELPSYLTAHSNPDPYVFVGYGLSRDTAEMIDDYFKDAAWISKSS